MSVRAPSLPVPPPAEADHSRLVRRAKTLSWLSVGWMAIEAGVATIAALAASSVALLGFGLNSLIETRFREHRDLALQRASGLERGS